MKLYWIKDKENGYWCKTRMKPSNSKDIPENYSIQGYWSKYSDSFSINHRVRHIWLDAKIQCFLMRLLAKTKTTLEKVN